VIFARKARELRLDREWSQARLGKRVGLGQSRVAAIEATGSVTIDQAQDFADAFGVPLEVLLYDKPQSASAVRVRQEQRLIQLYNAVDDAREQVARITREISAELPGKLPRGVIVGADWVQYPDGERRHGKYQEA
jgi:transcriptional regulator with XRE-family HTH domain